MSLATLLLLADSRFPTGAHAHSAGVEPSYGAGGVRSIADLAVFLDGRLATTARTEAAFVAAACRQPSRWAELDHELMIRTPSPRLRGVSRSLGRQLLRGASRAWPSLPVESLRALHVDGPMQPVALAAVASAAGLRPHDAALCSLHHLVGAVTTAAVRLMGSTRSPCRRSRPIGLRDSTRSPTRPPLMAMRRPTHCRRSPPFSPTSSPSTTAPGKRDSLPPDHDSAPAHDHHHDHGQHHDHEQRVSPDTPGSRPMRLGIGGPVGSGKTAFVAALCRLLADSVSTVVVTNDILTTEDAEALRRMAVLPDGRIMAVEPARVHTRRSATTFPPTSMPSSSSKQRMHRLS